MKKEDEREGQGKEWEKKADEREGHGRSGSRKRAPGMRGGVMQGG